MLIVYTDRSFKNNLYFKEEIDKYKIHRKYLILESQTVLQKCIMNDIWYTKDRLLFDFSVFTLLSKFLRQLQLERGTKCVWSDFCFECGPIKPSFRFFCWVLRLWRAKFVDLVATLFCLLYTAYFSLYAERTLYLFPFYYFATKAMLKIIVAHGIKWCLLFTYE